MTDFRIRISIHAPREGGDRAATFRAFRLAISIHAPREGGDENGVMGLCGEAGISIHAPREGGDYKNQH